MPPGFELQPQRVHEVVGQHADEQVPLGTVVDQLTLQCGKEALGQGVVAKPHVSIGIAHTALQGADSHLSAAVAKLDAGVLAALVRVVNH